MLNDFRRRCEKKPNGLSFNATQDGQAIAALKASSKKGNLKVKVSDEVASDTISVATLKLG
jgi:hypothetical protein